MQILKKQLYSTYRNLRIMADPDLHKIALEMLDRESIQKDAKILILAAGTGAFDQRLIDSGFENITSVDISTENYKAPKDNVVFLSTDLNDPFFAQKINNRYDLIVCMEIIEHVYSPNNFLLNCSSLLAKNGKILLSTPNPHSFISRVHTLLFGYPVLFLSIPEKFGHVSIIFYNILNHYAVLNNLKIKRIIPVSHFFKNISIYTYKSYFYYIIVLFFVILLLPIYPFISNKQKGLLSIYILTNTLNN